jgi:YfiH family protein
VFLHREVVGRAELAFTDRRGGTSPGGRAELDLGSASSGDHADRARANRELVARALDVDHLVAMTQVHGADVAWVDQSTGDGVPVADALLTATRGVGLLVRAADCTPVLLVDDAGEVAGAVHSGREGLVRGVVPAAVTALRERGAGRLRAWVGPRACGRCYELPQEMADAVADAVPQARSTTSWGTPAVDVGAGVVAQLAALDVTVTDVGAHLCTIEDERLFSYRRQGAESGRLGAVVVLR